MDFDPRRIDDFDEYFRRFDKGNSGYIKRDDFVFFVNSFFVNVPTQNEIETGPLQLEDLEGFGELDTIDACTGVSLFNRKFYPRSLSNFLFDSFDLKKTGRLSRDTIEYCVNGLAGRISNFQAKCVFRTLDRDRDGFLTHDEVKESRNFMGSKSSPSDTMKRFSDKIDGKPVDHIDFPTFILFYKGRAEPESAYASIPGISGGEGGCCYLL